MKSLKKCTLAAFLSLGILLSGCSKPKAPDEPPEFSQEFEKTAVLRASGREYKVQLRRGGADIWECVFTEPETIEGLRMTASGETCKLEFKGLEYTAERSDLPEYGVMPLVTQSVDALIEQRNITYTESEDSVVCRGTIKDRDFTAQARDNEIVSIDIPGCMSAEFS